MAQTEIKKDCPRPDTVGKKVEGAFQRNQKNEYNYYNQNEKDCQEDSQKFLKEFIDKKRRGELENQRDCQEVSQRFLKKFNNKKRRTDGVASLMAEIADDIGSGAADYLLPDSRVNNPDRWRDMSDLVAGCGSFLTFAVQDENCKLLRGNFCKNKFCPYCAWRRTQKVFGQSMKIMSFLKNSPESRGYRYIFLTLTQRNCAAEELNGVIDKMIAAWAAIARGSVLPGTEKSNKYSWLTEKVIKGAFRILEFSGSHGGS